MDSLQAMEVKAGMDLPRIWRNFGKNITFCGNIDVRELVSNNPERVRAEVDCKLRPVLAGGGSYILHSDHSIPPDVDYETYTAFLAYGRRLGQLTWPTPLGAAI